jgi:hypothetical protein
MWFHLGNPVQMPSSKVIEGGLPSTLERRAGKPHNLWLSAMPSARFTLSGRPASSHSWGGIWAGTTNTGQILKVLHQPIAPARAFP